MMEMPDTTPSDRKGWYYISCMVGDYEMDHQPNWGAEWNDLEEAVAEADKRWDWLRQRVKDEGLEVPKVTQLCVSVMEATDECAEYPLYTRGNQAAAGNYLHGV